MLVHFEFRQSKSCMNLSCTWCIPCLVYTLWCACITMSCIQLDVYPQGDPLWKLWENTYRIGNLSHGCCCEDALREFYWCLSALLFQIHAWICSADHLCFLQHTGAMRELKSAIRWRYKSAAWCKSLFSSLCPRRMEHAWLLSEP